MFALHFREQLASIKQVLVDELDQIVASAQSRWGRQHTQEGDHGDVTATSITAPSFHISGEPLRYQVSDDLAAGSDAHPIAVTLPAGTSFVEFFVDPTAPDAAHIKEIVIPGAKPGDLLWVLVSGTAFLHDSARRQAGVDPAAYTERIGNRLALRWNTTTTYSNSGGNFRVYDDSHRLGVMTFLRVDAYDYNLSTSGATHQCWVQIA